MKHILVVEDDVCCAKIFSMLTRMVFNTTKVFVANCYCEAEEILVNNSIDVAMVDYNIGHGKTGLDLARLIKKEYPKIYVILSSGSTTDYCSEQDLNSIVDAYIPKPIVLKDLKPIADKILGCKNV